jgi:hypothetical protein
MHTRINTRVKWTSAFMHQPASNAPPHLRSRTPNARKMWKPTTIHTKIISFKKIQTYQHKKKCISHMSNNIFYFVHVWPKHRSRVKKYVYFFILSKKISFMCIPTSHLICTVHKKKSYRPWPLHKSQEADLTNFKKKGNELTNQPQQITSCRGPPTVNLPDVCEVLQKMRSSPQMLPSDLVQFLNTLRAAPERTLGEAKKWVCIVWSYMYIYVYMIWVQVYLFAEWIYVRVLVYACAITVVLRAPLRRPLTGPWSGLFSSCMNHTCMHIYMHVCNSTVSLRSWASRLYIYIYIHMNMYVYAYMHTVPTKSLHMHKNI